jgi:hypothetical protein
MASYRMFFIEDGRIRSADAFEAPHDDAAKLYLEGLRRGRIAELWNRERLVSRYEASQTVSEPR